jgi:hypothetical protein
MGGDAQISHPHPLESHLLARLRTIRNYFLLSTQLVHLFHIKLIPESGKLDLDL